MHRTQTLYCNLQCQSTAKVVLPSHPVVLPKYCQIPVVLPSTAPIQFTYVGCTAKVLPKYCHTQVVLPKMWQYNFGCGSTIFTTGNTSQQVQPNSSICDWLLTLTARVQTRPLPRKRHLEACESGTWRHRSYDPVFQASANAYLTVLCLCLYVTMRSL